MIDAMAEAATSATGDQRRLQEARPPGTGIAVFSQCANTIRQHVVDMDFVPASRHVKLDAFR